MQRINIIDNPNFSKVHDFLCEFVQTVDVEAINSLVEQKFIKYLVKKEMDLGLIYRELEKAKELKLDYHILFYGLQYTLVEEMEDQYGSRDNDITLYVVVNYYKDGTFILSRDVMSKNDVIDYDESERTNSISLENRNSIKDMKEDFIKMLKDFLLDYLKNKSS
jgi:hypothetical protein